jgi:hypothetical protein
MQRKRLLTAGVGLVLVGMLGMIGWLAWSAMKASADVQNARLAITKARQASSEPDATEKIALATTQAASAASSARDRLDDPLWAVARSIPLLGCLPRAATDLTVVADELANKTLPQATAVVSELAPNRVFAGGVVDLVVVKRAGQAASNAAKALATADQQIAGVNTCGWWGEQVGLTAAKDQATAQISDLSYTINQAAGASAIAPALLGAKGKKEYLLVIANPSEARGSNGIVGAIAILTARNGVLSVDRFESNSFFPQPSSPRDPAEYGKDFARRYGDYLPTTYVANANASPDHPTGARVYLDMYADARGRRLDGVILTDPVALSYFLTATGPITLTDGEVLTASTLVPTLLSKSYARFDDPVQRDEYFARVGKAAAGAILTPSVDPRALLDGLKRAVSENRLLVYSTDEVVQNQLIRLPVGGALPQQTTGPFLGVVTENGSASKLDYYLDRDIDYTYLPNDDGSGIATIDVRLTNTAPKQGLPDYVTSNRRGTPRNTHRVWLNVFTGAGSGFTEATLDGKPVELEAETELGLTVSSLFVDLPAGQSRTLRLVVSEPKGGTALRLWNQPLVRPATTTVNGIEAIEPWR